MQETEKTILSTLSKTPSIVYQCSKEGFFIDFPIAFAALSIFGPVGGTVALQAASVSGLGYTASCTLGALAYDYYESPYALIAVKAIGNAGKYVAVKSVLIDSGKVIGTKVTEGFWDSIKLDYLDKTEELPQYCFAAFKGLINGALYGAASYYLPLNTNIVSAVPIEIIDSAISSTEASSIGQGFYVGAAVAANVYFYVNSGSIQVDGFLKPLWQFIPKGDYFVSSFNTPQCHPNEEQANYNASMCFTKKSHDHPVNLFEEITNPGQDIPQVIGIACSTENGIACEGN